MDLWTIVKVVVRRWYASLPVLAVAAAVGFVAVTGVPPSYQATGSVILFVPSGVAGDAAAERNNPYLSFSGSLSITASTLVRVLDAAEERRAFKGRGLSGEYAIQTESSFPGIRVAVVDEDRDRAVLTAQQLITAVGERLTALEDESGAPADQRIAVRVLESPASATELPPSVGRLAAVIVVLGLALATGVALLVEALARGRDRKWAPAAPFARDGSPAAESRLAGPLGEPAAPASSPSSPRPAAGAERTPAAPPPVPVVDPEPPAPVPATVTEPPATALPPAATVHAGVLPPATGRPPRPAPAVPAAADGVASPVPLARRASPPVASPLTEEATASAVPTASVGSTAPTEERPARPPDGAASAPAQPAVAAQYRPAAPAAGGPTSVDAASTGDAAGPATPSTPPANQAPAPPSPEGDARATVDDALSALSALSSLSAPPAPAAPPAPPSATPEPSVPGPPAPVQAAASVPGNTRMPGVPDRRPHPSALSKDSDEGDAAPTTPCEQARAEA